MKKVRKCSFCGRTAREGRGLIGRPNDQREDAPFICHICVETSLDDSLVPARVATEVSSLERAVVVFEMLETEARAKAAHYRGLVLRFRHIIMDARTAIKRIESEARKRRGRIP